MEQKKEKVFCGWRNGKINTVTLNNKTVQPKVFNGLPLAFDWGNFSLEAKQLAYTILCELYDEDIARRFYLDLSWEMIADWHTDKWVFPEVVIRKEMKKISERNN